MPPPLHETPEQKRLRLDRNNAARRKKRSLEETPEQRRQRLEKSNAVQRKRRAEETPEQRRERHARSSALAKKRRLEQTPEDRRRRREGREAKRKQKILGETPDQREERLERGRANQRKSRLLEKQRREGEGGEEELKKYREKREFENLTRRLTMTEEQREELRKSTYFYRQANKERFYMAYLPEEEQEARRERQRQYLKNLTGEKKQRYRESVAKAGKKQYEQMKANPERWEKWKEEQRARHRAQYAEETPEQRLRRRRKLRFYEGKRKLRRKLLEEGLPPEEIEKEVRELGRQMWEEFYPGEEPPGEGRRGRGKRTKKAEGSREGTPVSSPISRSPQDCCSINEKECSPRESWMKDEEESWPDSPTYSPPSSPPGDFEVVEALPEYSPDEEQECPHCTLVFFRVTDLRSHLLSSHADQCWKCPRCAQVFPSSSDLGEHYTSTHKNIRGQEALPTDTTSSFSAEQSNFLCLKCPPGLLQTFKTRKRLLEHVGQQHPCHFWPCKDCQLLKYSEKALNLHHLICRSSSQSKT